MINPCPPERGNSSAGRPSDCFLVARARAGDDVAFTVLLRRYHEVICRFVDSYFMAGGGRDDLLQAGRMGVFAAVRDYRPDRHESFEAFARQRITGTVINAAKHATSNRQQPLNTFVPFSASNPQRTDGCDLTLDETLPSTTSRDPLAEILANQALGAVIGCISTRLTMLESQVLTAYLQDRSHRNVARRLRCEEKTVDNALQRVRRKIRAHYASA